MIVLYLLSAILVFIKIEPFTTSGIFLSICYLPGLCMFAFARKKKLSYDDLLLSFPLSIGISSLIVLVLLSAGLHIRYIPVIIHAVLGIAVVLHLFVCYRQKVYPVLDVSSDQLRYSCFALLLTLLLCIPFIYGANRLAISAHAFHHSLLVSQIFNGIFPPENPGLGGTIIGYYWGFHALIAALAIKTDFQQIQIIFILNVLSLYLIFCISYCVAEALDLAKPYRYILPLAIIGLVRIDAGILFLVKLFSGELTPISQLTASPREPFEILSEWTMGLPWKDSRQFPLHKLYNVSGMLMALSLCYSYLLILLRSAPRISGIDLAGIALIISACFFNYPPLAIFLLLHLPLWSGYIFLTTRGDLKQKLMESFRVIVPYIAGGLIVSPYMLYVMASRDMSSGGQGGIFSFNFYEQSLKNMVVFMVPFPIIVYGAWEARKKLGLSREFYFLATGTLLCLFLTLFTRWPFDNSYKYNYILTFFFSCLFVFGVRGVCSFFPAVWPGRLITVFMVILLLGAPVIDESSRILSSFTTGHVYSYSGKHIIYAQDAQRNEAFAWIRDNTPGDSIIMLSYTKTNWPCCGFNNNYEPAAMAERTLYSIEDADYTVSNPEYAKRIYYRGKLFEDPWNQEVIDYFSNLNRPVYLLVEKDLNESSFFVEDRFKPFPPNLGGHFPIVFQNSRQRIYQLFK